MASTTTRLTADEFLSEVQLREREERQERAELIDGEVVVTAPTVWHQLRVGALVTELTIWTRGGPGRGYVAMDVNFRLDDANVYRPDVWWFTPERVPREGSDAFVAGPPDLAVEVRSPSTWRYDIGRKKEIYEEQGLPELWLVDPPGGVVLVFRRSRPAVKRFDTALEVPRGEAVTSPQLAGFALSVDALLDVG